MQSSQDASNTKPYKVVVGIDFSTAGASTLARALAIANAQPKPEVHLVSVLEPQPTIRGHEMPPDAAAQLEQLASQAAYEVASKCEDTRIPRLVTHLLVGTPACEIVWLAAYLDADLIVVG